MMILKMSLSSGALILVITFIRCILLNRLPKKTFLFLWGVALFRLLVPLSIPSQFSIYTMANAFWHNAAAVPKTAHHINTADNTISAIATHSRSIFFSITPLEIIWLLGLSACALFFLVAHARNLRKYKTALPIENLFMENWKQTHPLLRNIEIRQSDQINTALTYRLFRPIILLPKTTDWADETTLRYVLTHEYIHIRRFDILRKWLFFIAVCIHWFNPLVWMMFLLANRDIELSCDETVVRIFGEAERSNYALTLIKLEEKKLFLPTFVNHFSRNAIKERTVSIMKTKKASHISIMCAIIIIAAVIAVFATDAGSISADTVEFASEEGSYEPLITETNSAKYVTAKKTVHLKNGMMTEFDMENGQLIICKNGETDWLMKQGETMTLDISIENILNGGQTVVIGYLNNDTYTDIFNGRIINQQTITFTAPKTGAYSFYLIGASSDTVRIRSVLIK